jgi:hypothetical protein
MNQATENSDSQKSDFMAGLDLTQQAKLRQIIHEHLGSTDVYSRIRSFVRDFIESEQGVALEEDKLLSTLHEKVNLDFSSLAGVISQLDTGYH